MRGVIILNIWYIKYISILLVFILYKLLHIINTDYIITNTYLYIIDSIYILSWFVNLLPICTMFCDNRFVIVI